MERTRTLCPALRALVLAAFGLWLFLAGGCAVLPFAITTTASFAMPQTASLAMTGVKGAYNAAAIATDERDVNTIMRDNVLSLKAKSALLTTRGRNDVQVHAYNGELYAVGVVDSPADRERIVQAMQNVKGVSAVKGYIRLRDNDPGTTELADMRLENSAKLALARHLLHKNAGIDVQAVNGQLCLIGGVGTHAEALDLIQYLESITGARALSLLAIRDEYASGGRQTNRLYLLDPGPQESVQAKGASQPSLMDGPMPLPSSPLRLAEAPEQAPVYRPAQAASPSYTYRAAVTPPQRPAQLAQSQSAAAKLPALNKARAFAQQRLISLAKAEANPEARGELLSLADAVAQDRDVSIADRLSVAAAQATQQQARTKIQALLAMY